MRLHLNDGLQVKLQERAVPSDEDPQAETEKVKTRTQPGNPGEELQEPICQREVTRIVHLAASC